MHGRITGFSVIFLNVLFHVAQKISRIYYSFVKEGLPSVWYCVIVGVYLKPLLCVLRKPRRNEGLLHNSTDSCLISYHGHLCFITKLKML